MDLSHTPTLSRLTPLEWRVVALAKREAASWWFEAPSAPVFANGVRRALARLIGRRFGQPLADARLETLRLFVVLRRRSDRLAEGFAAQLIALGFAHEDVRRIAAVAES